MAVFTVPDSINVTAVRPGLYLDQEGRVVALHADGSLVTPNTPASPGEEVVIFVEAMDATNPEVASGAPGPGAPPAEPRIRAAVTIGDREAAIVWTRMTPGVVGSDQLRFVIPPGVRSGALPMWVKQNEIASNAAVLQVR